MCDSEAFLEANATLEIPRIIPPQLQIFGIGNDSLKEE